MTEREYLIGVAHLATALLRNAAKSYGIDFAIVNETMIETERRARALGMDRIELYGKDAVAR